MEVQHKRVQLHVVEVQEIRLNGPLKLLRKNRRSKNISSLQKHSCEVHVKCAFL